MPPIMYMYIHAVLFVFAVCVCLFTSICTDIVMFRTDKPQDESGEADTSEVPTEIEVEEVQLTLDEYKAKQEKVNKTLPLLGKVID